MTRLLVLCAARFVGSAIIPSAASAATCADYSNQAAAQRAADTRDADGDGVYCEDLPCPCLKPGGSGSGSGPSPATPRLGRPRALEPWTQRSGCELRGALPDRQCTPGSIYAKATRGRICVRVACATSRSRQGSGSTARTGSAITGPANTRSTTWCRWRPADRNSVADLFPQPAHPRGGGLGFHDKDRLENVVQTGSAPGPAGCARRSGASPATGSVTSTTSGSNRPELPHGGATGPSHMRFPSRGRRSRLNDWHVTSWKRCWAGLALWARRSGVDRFVAIVAAGYTPALRALRV
ncbi:MAG: hypothetical protein QOE86_2906 [Solirubrobacteraceae bacterium]|nr:hypothetical protein [Solirubrobacteraceae bacterium]